MHDFYYAHTPNSVIAKEVKRPSKKTLAGFFLDCRAVCDGSQGRVGELARDWIAAPFATSRKDGG